jgi:CDP-diglyceride synthetase
MATWFVALLVAILIFDSYLSAIENERWESLSFVIYRCFTIYIITRLVLAMPFFLNKRKKQDPNSKVHYWIISLAVLNLSHQIAGWTWSLLLFLGSYRVLTISEYTNKQVFLLLSVIAIVKDLLTALSILYLHHRMGLREM